MAIIIYGDIHSRGNMKYLEERATNIEPLADYKEISTSKNLRIKLESKN